MIDPLTGLVYEDGYAARTDCGGCEVAAALRERVRIAEAERDAAERALGAARAEVDRVRELLGGEATGQ